VRGRRVEDSTVRPNYRSISGAALMLVIIPIFAGLLACMPEYVPLGNPERARIDKGMSGMWFVEGEGIDSGLMGNIVFLEPWDKRTWLITSIGIQESSSADVGDLEYDGDLSTYDGFVDLFEHPEVDEDDFEFGTMQYKSWLVKLGGEKFMTWELRVVKDAEEQLLEPWYWQDFRVTEMTEDRLVLHLINPDFEPLEAAPMERRHWEKVVRKHADDEALYFEEEIVLQRVKLEDLELFIELQNHALWGPMM
jgi:hypothetical protein